MERLSCKFFSSSTFIRDQKSAGFCREQTLYGSVIIHLISLNLPLIDITLKNTCRLFLMEECR